MVDVVDDVKAPVSSRYFARAQQLIPGGVNSPVRAFKAVGGIPRFFQSASGAVLTDVDGREYIDFVGSWGPMICGHAHPQVQQAVIDAVQRSTSFGAPCPDEVALADCVVSKVPSIDQLRLVNSGTEAVMSACRLARGYTQRDKLVKFIGCYHGHVDALLAEAGSGVLSASQPTAPGIPQAVTADTLQVPYNDLAAFEQLMRQYGEQVAAVIVEPLAGNMGLVHPQPGFLEGLRAACDHFGCLLIFDEVMTGFRVSPSGYQGLTEVRPDLTTLGKIIGGGLPVGAFGGRAEIMQQLAPQGPVYQAGTLSGNPCAMAAGLATLRQLDASAYHQLSTTTQYWIDEVNALATQQGVALQLTHACGMLGLFCTDQPVTQLADVQATDQQRFARLFHALLEEGVYWPPSPYECAFLSLAHDMKLMESSVACFARALKRI